MKRRATPPCGNEWDNPQPLTQEQIGKLDDQRLSALVSALAGTNLTRYATQLDWARAEMIRRQEGIEPFVPHDGCNCLMCLAERG